MKTLLLAVLFSLFPVVGLTQSAPMVILTWTASSSPGVTGYDIYKITNPTSTQCPANGNSLTGFTLVNSTPVTGTTYNDTAVVTTDSYCYTVTSVTPGGQSFPSNMVLLPQAPALTVTPQ